MWKYVTLSVPLSPVQKPAARVSVTDNDVKKSLPDHRGFTPGFRPVLLLKCNHNTVRMINVVRSNILGS